MAADNIIFFSPFGYPPIIYSASAANTNPVPGDGTVEPGDEGGES